MAHDAEFKKAKEGQMSKAAKMTEAHGQMLNTLLQMRGSGVTVCISSDVLLSGK